MLQMRVCNLIAMRCGEPGLSESDVASALVITPAEVTKVLAAHGKTFAEVLTLNRMQVATRMLKSRTFAELSDHEISERSGFSSKHAMATALLTQMRRF